MRGVEAARLDAAVQPASRPGGRTANAAGRPEDATSRLTPTRCDAVVPAFYERDEAGIPRAWVQRIKHSLRSIGPRFNAGRMLRDYTETVYRPR